MAGIQTHISVESAVGGSSLARIPWTDASECTVLPSASCRKMTLLGTHSRFSSGVVVVLLLFVEVAHMGAGRDSVLAVTVTWAGEVM